MGHVPQHEFQLLIESFLNLARQAVIAFFERLAELILSYSCSHFNPSPAVLNFGESWSLPSSSSTWTSVSCHSLVQYQPWEGSMHT